MSSEEDEVLLELMKNRAMSQGPSKEQLQLLKLENYLIRRFYAAITTLPFKTRTVNVLKKAGVSLVQDLLAEDEESLLRIPNFGPKSLEEALGIVEYEGWWLGMDVEAYRVAWMEAGHAWMEAGHDGWR